MKAWERRLRIASLGGAQARDYHGQDNFPGDVPTLLLVVRASLQEAAQKLQPALHRLEFDEYGPSHFYWWRVGDQDTVRLGLTALQKGQTQILPGQDRVFRATVSSVVVYLSVASGP